MSEFTDAVLAAHRSSKPKATLLVDVDRDLGIALAREEGVLALSKTGKKPEEMWAFAGAGTLGLVVISAKRAPREMFRVLLLAERLVASGGVIFVLGEDEESVAVKTFCEVNRWGRGMGTPAGSIALRRAVVIEGKVGFALQQASRCVISLSVFGPGGEHGYWRYLPTVIRAYLVLFPGYEIRIHHDDHIYQAEYGDVLYGLERRGVIKLVRMAADGIAEGKCKAMLWRLAPCWDPEVDHVFCRDVDSLPTWRDRMCCEEFIASGCAVGTIHDDSQHAGIMGGLCHVDARFVRATGFSFQEFIANAGDVYWSQHGADQVYLNKIASSFPGILEHSLFTTVGEGGERRHRDTPTCPNADFRTAIAEPSKDVVDSVPEAVRQMSDSFVNYMGAAGMWKNDAEQFYEMVSDRTMVVDAAEQFARWRA